MGEILEAAKAKIGNDFSAENIGNELKAALEGKSNLSDLGGTGTVGMYNEETDGEVYWKKRNSTEGYASPKIAMTVVPY